MRRHPEIPTVRQGAVSGSERRVSIDIDPESGRNVYDYLLVVGPGRSGSEFLYRALRDHPSFVFPEIKERSYYRSPKALARARRRLDTGQLLCDIANGAYADPQLPDRVEALSGEGFRVLLVALLRDHRERAVSMMQFRRSRGEHSALFGAKRLERAVVRDRLTAERLAAILRPGVDVLTLSFPALTRETGAVLDVLASLCGVAGFDRVPRQAVNESVHPRRLMLSAVGHWGALVLRHLGFRRLLQRVKEHGLVTRVFFTPPPPGAARPRLSEEAVNALAASAIECRSIVERSSEQLSEGVYLRKVDAVGSRPA